MLLEVFDIHISMQHMEYFGVLRQYLVSLLVQSCPSCVLIIIVSNRVEFLLVDIKKVTQVVCLLNVIESSLLCLSQ
jgi:hypothetical protein